MALKGGGNTISRESEDRALPKPPCLPPMPSTVAYRRVGTICTRSAGAGACTREVYLCAIGTVATVRDGRPALGLENSPIIRGK
jgi:hypothetical protein